LKSEPVKVKSQVILVQIAVIKTTKTNKQKQARNPWLQARFIFWFAVKQTRRRVRFI